MLILRFIFKCAAFLALGFFALWILDKYIAIGKREFEADCREQERDAIRGENARWYAETRAEDNRADLFRDYCEMEVN